MFKILSYLNKLGKNIKYFSIRALEKDKLIITLSQLILLIGIISLSIYFSFYFLSGKRRWFYTIFILMTATILIYILLQLKKKYSPKNKVFWVSLSSLFFLSIFQNMVMIYVHPVSKKLENYTLNDLTRKTFVEEVWNFVVGFYPQLKQHTIIVAPGLLDEMLIDPIYFQLYLQPDIQTRSYNYLINKQQVDRILENPFQRWRRLDGGNYILIQPANPDTPYVIVKHENEWFLLPYEVFLKELR